jgi:hypothetical protein
MVCGLGYFINEKIALLKFSNTRDQGACFRTDSLAQRGILLFPMNFVLYFVNDLVQTKFSISKRLVLEAITKSGVPLGKRI